MEIKAEPAGASGNGSGRIDRPPAAKLFAKRLSRISKPSGAWTAPPCLYLYSLWIMHMQQKTMRSLAIS